MFETRPRNLHPERQAGGESTAETEDGSSEYNDYYDDGGGGSDGGDNEDESTQRAGSGQADRLSGDGGDGGKIPRRARLAPRGTGPHELEQVGICYSVYVKCWEKFPHGGTLTNRMLPNPKSVNLLVA